MSMIALFFVVAMPSAADPNALDYPLIESLDIADLAAGRHQFWFHGGDDGIGGDIRVPVMVLKGAKAGQTLTLITGSHGDELNGIGVIYQLFDEIDASAVSGAIIAVPGLNVTGLIEGSRYFTENSGGGRQIDLNRIWPGDPAAGTAAVRFIGNIWTGIIEPNSDVVIDLHTQTEGAEYPLFVFADCRSQEIKRIAYLLGPDVIKNDRGGKGTLERALLDRKIPAVTLELGAPKIFQPQMISRGVLGIRRVMEDRDMIPKVSDVSALPVPIVGHDYSDVTAERGGAVVVKVGLLQRVLKGDVLAYQFGPFGKITETYRAPHSGYILATVTDPLREPGSLIVRILKGQPKPGGLR